MVKQKSSLWERLKICYNVLKHKNYVYFGIGNDPIIWDENGKYKKIDRSQLSAYSCISYDYKFDSDNGIMNLHDFVWNTIEKFAKDAQNGKY